MSSIQGEDGKPSDKIWGDSGLRIPDRSKIACVTCKHRKPDFVQDGEVRIHGYANAYCEEYPEGKPMRVLKGSACGKYEQE